MAASTDGWTFCALGHRHWGLAGAAGLLVHRGGAEGCELLLQHRAWWSHHGGTWGTPGGALHAGEAARDGALREVREELGLRGSDLVLGEPSVDDHGGWSYTTVLAEPSRGSRSENCGWTARATAWRGCPWQSCDEVDLHPGFAAALPRLRPLLQRAVTERKIFRRVVIGRAVVGKLAHGGTAA